MKLEKTKFPMTKSKKQITNFKHQTENYKWLNLLLSFEN